MKHNTPNRRAPHGSIKAAVAELEVGTSINVPSYQIRSYQDAASRLGFRASTTALSGGLHKMTLLPASPARRASA